MEFEQVYDLYFQDVYRYIRRLSGSEHVAEEITSETFSRPCTALENSAASATFGCGCARSPETATSPRCARRSEQHHWMSCRNRRTAAHLRRSC